MSGSEDKMNHVTADSEMPDIEGIGTWVRRLLRVERGLSQRELSERGAKVPEGAPRLELETAPATR